MFDKCLQTWQFCKSYDLKSNVLSTRSLLQVCAFYSCRTLLEHSIVQNLSHFLSFRLNFGNEWELFLDRGRVQHQYMKDSA